MTAFNDFLEWEQPHRHLVDFNAVYVDMAGHDLAAGLFLGQIVGCYLPEYDRLLTCRVQRSGHVWIARRDDEWYADIRLSAKQIRRARAILTGRHPTIGPAAPLLLAERHRFHHTPVNFVRLHEANFLCAWEKALMAGCGVAEEQGRRGAEEQRSKPPISPAPQHPISPAPLPYAPDEFWQAALAELKRQMTRATFDQWLAQSRAGRYDEASGLFVVVAPSAPAAAWLNHRLRETIERTLTGLAGRPVSFRAVIE